MGEDEDFCPWNQEHVILGPEWSLLPLIVVPLLDFILLCKARGKILSELGP